MAADAWVIYNKFLEYMADGTIDLDGDTFKVALVASGYTPSVSGHSTFADITNELSTANGYTAGGATLGTVTWAESGGTATFDCANPSWTASGGAITARYAVIYDDTPTSPADPLVAYCLLDNTPADVSAADGADFTISINASGIFTLAAA
jgi:hypothetical protein